MKVISKPKTEIRYGLIASAALTDAKAGTGVFVVKPTVEGRRLLKQAKRIAITETDSFTPTGSSAVILSRTIDLQS